MMLVERFLEMQMPGRQRLHYWVNAFQNDRPTLVFLPGLTADHRLFDRQIEYFQDRYNCLTWDAPGHGKSRPFPLDFTLDDKAGFLMEILKRENVRRPVLIGQSMGGYVAQAFMERYPDRAAGFVSIDSAPLQRRYMTAAEIWALRHCGPIYRAYPWKALQKAGQAVAVSEYGRKLMLSMMQSYTKDEYCALAAHGFRILADAVVSNRPYRITCPAILICGKQDRAGSAKRYNRAWAKTTGLPIHWIDNAGHNSNTDQPDEINSIILKLIQSIPKDH